MTRVRVLEPNSPVFSVCSAVLHEWDYVFSENGLLAFKEGKEIGRTVRSLCRLPIVTDEFRDVQSIKDHLGEEKLKQFLNFCLRYLSEIDIPIKRFATPLHPGSDFSDVQRHVH